MSTNLNKKVAYLTLVIGTVTTPLLADGSVTSVKVAPATLAFDRTQVGFASALLATQKRAVYPMIGGAAQAIPAASSMVVTPSFAGVPVSAAAPNYDGVNRVWINLGAVTYAPDNRVYMAAPGSNNSADSSNPVLDANGQEVYGRLSNAAGVWTVSFYHLVAGVETPYTFPGPTTALMLYKQWIDLSNPLNEDQIKTIVTAPGMVEITETANITQLARDLGVTLSATGAMSLSPSIIQRITNHALGTTERHTSDMIDAAAGVAIAGLTLPFNATSALNQLNANAIAGANAALSTLQTYFNERHSNGIAGATPVATPGAGLNVTIASATAYVQGKRFAIAAGSIVVPASAVTKIWVDTTGAIQQGAAYPADANMAALGTATATASAITGVVDDHRALIGVEGLIYSIQSIVNAHLASSTAHALASITYSNAVAPLTLVDNVTPISTSQQAIEAIVRRANAFQKGVFNRTLIQSDIDNATVSGALRFIRFTTPTPYRVGNNTMEVIIDGDDQDIGSVFLESSPTTVDVYFDPASPLVAGMNVKLRWIIF